MFCDQAVSSLSPRILWPIVIDISFIHSYLNLGQHSANSAVHCYVTVNPSDNHIANLSCEVSKTDICSLWKLPTQKLTMIVKLTAFIAQSHVTKSLQTGDRPLPEILWKQGVDCHWFSMMNTRWDTWYWEYLTIHMRWCDQGFAWVKHDVISSAVCYSNLLITRNLLLHIHLVMRNLIPEFERTLIFFAGKLTALFWT